jgi:catechol 2,3-dioxygenase-like lactoylglutathione lyase family enzyme
MGVAPRGGERRRCAIQSLTAGEPGTEDLPVMIISDVRLLYLFLEVVDLRAARHFFERAIGLPLIEVEPHMPHHRHGVVKYDAGSSILSLNLSKWSRFDPHASDALVAAIAIDAADLQDRLARSNPGIGMGQRGIFTERHGHHFEFRRKPSRAPMIEELRLTVNDLEASVAFYRDLLDMPLLKLGPEAARFAVGDLDLVLERGTTAADGRRLFLKSYLPVFYTPDIVATQRELIARGVFFRHAQPGFSEIGGSSRFEDPSGHTLCLYQPSDESLTWGSGSKVVELIRSRGGSNADRIANRLPVPVRD